MILIEYKQCLTIVNNANKPLHRICPTMIQEERLKRLNSNAILDGKYVLYWMQASQRTDYNHALEYAILVANRYQLPVVTYFGLTTDYPEATERSYLFLLEGLVDVDVDLQERNIPFALRLEDPSIGVRQLAKECALMIVDRGYQKLQREWRNKVSESVGCPVIQVESNVVVPIETASPKEEYSAGTFRPKHQRVLDGFLEPLPKNEVAFPFKGSIFFLFVVSGLFLVCGLGIGLFISTVTKSQQLAFMLAIVLTMLPAFILSGFLFPISSMPRIIQFFSYLVPAKYFLIALRGIFLKGNDLSVLWPEVLFLLVFGFLIILACTKRLKLNLE